MSRFLVFVKRATVIAFVALLVGLPGCAQVDISAGPGAAAKPTPGWAIPLILVAILALLALVVLIPTMIVTRIAIYIRAGADTTERKSESDEPPSRVINEAPLQTTDGVRRRRGTPMWRGALVGALILLLVGISLSVDTDNSEWVIPDPESGWIGVPLVVVAIGVLAVLLWRRQRTER